MAAPDRIARSLLKPFARACKEFELLEEGDRIAVGVSGGEDSRILLDFLLRYRDRLPFSPDLLAIHVDGSDVGLPDVRPQLIPWLEGLPITYHVVPLELPPDEPLPLDCFRCAWNRRRALFTAAADAGCNKVALGHHADDAAVTTLMSLMFAGRLETMEPKVSFFDGKIVLVRPLIYLPKKDLIYYANAADYAIPPECPQAEDAKRDQIERFLRTFGPHQEQIRKNLWRTAREAMGF